MGKLMIVTTLVDCKEDKDVVAKGTKGLVVGVQWGDRGDGYVINFPQVSRMFVSREKVAIVTEDKNASEKSRTQEEEGKVGKSKRKKELPPPTVGKGSIDP